MAPAEMTSIRRRARRAYELGRLRWALTRSLCVTPFLLAALAPRQELATTAGAVALLFAVAVALSVYGRAAGRALFPALAAGLVPLIAPISMCVLGHACDSARCMSLCLPACCIGGLIAGAIVAARARQETDLDERRLFLGAACVIVALTGAVGCTVAGAAGVLGMMGATLLASAPALRPTT